MVIHLGRVLTPGCTVQENWTVTSHYASDHFDGATPHVENLHNSGFDLEHNLTHGKMTKFNILCNNLHSLPGKIVNESVCYHWPIAQCGFIFDCTL